MRSDVSVYEELLVLRAQDGEPSALSELVDRWHMSLVRYAHHLTGDKEAAAEVMQEVWLSVVRSLRHLDDPARFRPWVYRIVTNKSTDWIRRRVRARASTLPLNDAALKAPEAVEEPSDEIAKLRTALAQLPPTQRAILSMFYLEDMSIRDIATILTIPEGTVKSRMHHARHLLKQILQEQEE